MKNPLFKGAGVALITPMNADGSVNHSRLRELVDFQVDGGTDAIIVCGTTGESATLTTEEHVDTIKTVVDQTKGRIPVIAGTGSNDTAYAIELSKEAEELGVDGLLMVSPYYNKTSQAGLIAHFSAVADAVSIPIIVYNVPSRTGTAFKPETYLALSAHKNIIGVKEANGDISMMAKTASLCGDNFLIYSGNDDEIVPCLSLGGSGIISVLSNIAPKVVHDICAKFFEGDIDGSRKLQLEYIELMNALFSDVNPIPIKEAMNLMGMNVGPLRLPLVPMSDDARAKLADCLKKKGLM